MFRQILFHLFLLERNTRSTQISVKNKSKEAFIFFGTYILYKQKLRKIFLMYSIRKFRMIMLIVISKKGFPVRKCANNFVISKEAFFSSMTLHPITCKFSIFVNPVHIFKFMHPVRNYISWNLYIQHGKMQLTVVSIRLLFWIWEFQHFCWPPPCGYLYKIIYQ